MATRQTIAAAGFLFALALAACGGGGGGGGSNPLPGNPTNPPSSPTTNPSSNPTSNPTSHPTSNPTTTPSAAVSGTLPTTQGHSMANASLLFTCGCSAQAGTVAANGSGQFTVTSTSTAVPNHPAPTYTAVPGRNYMLIATASGANTQVWTLEFLGKTPATNLNLSGTLGAGPTTDAASTAAALYIYKESQSNSDTSFDAWNFNAIANWYKKSLAMGGANAAEQKLIADVQSLQGSGTAMWPTVPVWAPTGSTSNATINTDITAVFKSGDTNLPTPCPSVGCASTPTP